MGGRKNQRCKNRGRPVLSSPSLMIFREQFGDSTELCWVRECAKRGQMSPSRRILGLTNPGGNSFDGLATIFSALISLCSALTWQSIAAASDSSDRLLDQPSHRDN